MMGVLCATAEKSGLLKKRTAVLNLKASDYVGLPNKSQTTFVNTFYVLPAGLTVFYIYHVQLHSGPD